MRHKHKSNDGHRRRSLSSAYSHFGGKAALAHLYPPPRRGLIIEPFGGGGGYALRYADHDVWLNDIDGDTFALWTFLTGGRASLEYLRMLPRYVIVGQPVDDLMDWSAVPPGLYQLVQSLVSCATYGTKGRRTRVSPLAAPRWPMAVRRVERVLSRVAHWKITNLSYDQLPNLDASWFVDAPYRCEAGERYKYPASEIDFEHLAAWCMDRFGQVTVCEQAGANWLPFVPLTQRRRAIRSRPRRLKSNFGEVIYERPGCHTGSGRVTDLRSAA